MSCGVWPAVAACGDAAGGRPRGVEPGVRVVAALGVDQLREPADLTLDRLDAVALELHGVAVDLPFWCGSLELVLHPVEPLLEPRLRRPSRIRSRAPMSVRLKKANRTSKLSSSQAEGPTSAISRLNCSVPAGGELVDDPLPTAGGPRLGSGHVLGDPAGLEHLLQGRVERAVGQQPAPAEHPVDLLAQLVAVHGRLVQQSEDCELEGLTTTGHGGPPALRIDRVLSGQPIVAIYRACRHRRRCTWRTSAVRPYPGRSRWAYPVQGVDPSRWAPCGPDVRPPCPGVPLSPDRKATPSRGGNGPKKNAPTRRRPDRPDARKAAKPGAKTASGKPRKSLGRRLLKWVLLAVLAVFLLGGRGVRLRLHDDEHPGPEQGLPGADDVRLLLRRQARDRPVRQPEPHEHPAVRRTAARPGRGDRRRGPDLLRPTTASTRRASCARRSATPRGGSTQGASTITQQYVKILYLSQERTLTRKVKEAFVSLKIQRQQSKDEILQGYLNTIYFGRGAYGIQAAAQAYFDKDAKDLTVQEGAVLASVLNSPDGVRPGRRRRTTGSGCSAATSTSWTGWPAWATSTPARPSRLKRGCRSSRRSRARTSTAASAATCSRWSRTSCSRTGFSDQEISGGGLRVTTTFTRNAMDAAEKACRRPAAAEG